METSVTVDRERGEPRRVGRAAREVACNAALKRECSMVRGKAFAYMEEVLADG
ncbi:hypothetical protein [Paraburkholderia sp. BR14320]|uniref:hypothetical protein n=1 Tax=unclassified Paraburkholderia TaxID=2615204 RepID=UPI0034CE4E1E